MNGNVLVIGTSGSFGEALQTLLPGSNVRSVPCTVETEGIDVDVVVIVHPQPLPELTEVRVHPALHDKPVVLLAPGLDLAGEAWSQVWPVTATGGRAVEELVETIGLLIDRSLLIAQS